MTDTSECDSQATEHSFDKRSTANLDTNLQILCKQMLKTRVFLGQYQEKRFVDTVKGYRDLIVINHSQVEVICDFEAVQRRILREYGGFQHMVWIGFTGDGMIGAPAGSCIWTELSENVPFGEYWFQVKTVRFRANEVIVKLKVLREAHQSDQLKTKKTKSAKSSDDANASITNKTTNGPTYATDQMVDDFSELLEEWRQSIRSKALWLMPPKVTANNAWQTIRFVSLLLIAALTGSVQAVKFIGLFTLRFMEELSKLLHVLTPLLLRCADLVNKTIGGFYILIAMIWRDSIGGGGGGSRSVAALRQQQLAIMPPAKRYNRSFSNRMGQERRDGWRVQINPSNGSGQFRH